MAPPIPAQPVGYQQGSCQAPIQVDVFVDIECPYSRKAWPTVAALPQTFDGKLSVTLYPVVLADHRQSWDVTKAAVLLAGDDDTRFWNLFGDLYDRQSEFSQPAFEHKTHQDLVQWLARFASEETGQSDPDEWIQQLQDEAIAQKTKAPIRFGIVQGVWSTPTFFINGSEATDLSSSSSLEDWQETLQPLLTP